ncbi:3-hydroxybutyryl-CoA dehydrogenase [Micromonospora peucetia]|uniref:3-hydroxyacyl-CoA dehydrogenase n=1 Tax=Micromonospora peucetia TaxID=47871 RepID=A0A1C6U935_9ACTN|nr:3-hydroxybutyryl-CoA dehydrogenase [Micromonospora peucetia]MCX4386308.1 3-hydroxybutyryl-CoA dehydrogenase [Micromonospora peucetia]WSA33650.1 3-hydroxybutyryl-CoA dehydrogenase [Micromonospora peucetia]SCL50547.1 3-hydroxyacyl-CoA dehydrogenase [Micromonospora peucetia]
MDRIRRVGVVGCGVMGAGVAETCARAGLDVLVAVSRPASVAPGRARLTASLDRAVGRGKLSEADRDAELARVSFTADLTDFADRQLVIEAASEQESIKLDVFATLDKVVEDEDAILGSNTSSLPIVKLGGVTARPEQVVGIHFFNPAPVLPLVEVVGSVRTDARTIDTVDAFVTDVLGKQVVRAKDRAGFVVNALLIPYLLSAVRMLESGMATVTDIDKAMTLGCAHPMGPLRLVDLIGLDIVAAISESLYREFREPHYSPPPLLARMVAGGMIGKKCGRGFYEYGR